MRTIRNSRGLR